MANLSELPGAEYMGTHGISRDCRDAIMELLQFGNKIKSARIITCGEYHAFILSLNEARTVVIKSGFASGYPGTGPTTFSYVLQLLEAFGIEIDEYEVKRDFFERLEHSALTQKDFTAIRKAQPIRPTRYWDYILDRHHQEFEDGTLLRQFPPIIPYAVIDPRLMDLAISFWSNPDNALVTGYRRLEDIVRKRSGLDDWGKELFSKTFREPNPKLKWKGIKGGERQGRIDLFSGVYLAHRNPRGHKEPKSQYYVRLLAEFLALNHLYMLEGEAIKTRQKKSKV